MNILIVKLSSIGDVVHTLPAAAVLRRHYPEAHITWVVEEAALDIIRGNPHIDRILVSRRKAWARDLCRGRRIAETLKEIKEFVKILRDRPYDIVIDFMSLLKSSLVVLLSGGVRKIGYDTMQELSGLFVKEKILEDMSRHAVDRYLDFPRYLGATVEEAEFYIPVPGESEGRVRDLLAQGGIRPGERFVAVSPMSFAGETRLWDDDKFAALCDRIVTKLGMPVVFTGQGSGGMIDRIRAMMTAPSINLEGRTSLPELAALYGMAALLVTPDSGPMHIAAAVGTPVIALFGPSDPARTGPYGVGHTVIQRSLPCSPCFLKTCPTRQCMHDIAVAEVYEAVKKKAG